MECQQNNFSKRTLEHYQAKTTRFLNFLGNKITTPQQVKPVHITLFLLDYRKGHKPSSEHGYYRAIHASFSYMKAKGVIKKHPMEGMKPPKVPRNLSKDFFDFCQHVFFYRCGLTSMGYISNLIGREYIMPTREQLYNHTGYTITTLPHFHALHFNLTEETAEVVALDTQGARPHLKFLSEKQNSPRAKK